MASPEEQGTTYRTEGGAIFGNLSASGDINIIHTTIRTLADEINATFFATSYPEMFDQVKHELNQLIPFIGIAVAKYPEFNRDEKYFSALNQELYRCQDVLNDLQELQKYYEDLPSQARIAWERTAIGASSLADMRAKIASSRQIFTMLNTEIIKLSQANTIRYISRWIKEYKNEHKAASIISGLSSGAESLNDGNTWTRIRQELEEIGMAPEAFERNKGLIHERLEKAISSGDLSDVFEAGSTNHHPKSSISSLSKAPGSECLLPLCQRRLVCGKDKTCAQEGLESCGEYSSPSQCTFSLGI